MPDPYAPYDPKKPFPAYEKRLCLDCAQYWESTALVKMENDEVVCWRCATRRKMVMVEPGVFEKQRLCESCGNPFKYTTSYPPSLCTDCEVARRATLLDESAARTELPVWLL